MPRRVSLPGAEELFRGSPSRRQAEDRKADGANDPAGSNHPGGHESAPDPAPADPTPKPTSTSPEPSTSPELVEGPSTSPESSSTSPELIEGPSTSPELVEGPSTSPEPSSTSPELVEGRPSAGQNRTGTDDAHGRRRGHRRGSGRVRHDEKITVYVSRDELLALERARLSLRAEYGMAVDRGRIVREALALVLEDLNERGEDSELARRLTQP